MSSHRRCCCNSVGCCPVGGFNPCGILLDGSGNELTPSVQISGTFSAISGCIGGSPPCPACSAYFEQITINGTFPMSIASGSTTYCDHSVVVVEEEQLVSGAGCDALDLFQVYVSAEHFAATSGLGYDRRFRVQFSLTSPQASTGIPSLLSFEKYAGEGTEFSTVNVGFATATWSGLCPDQLHVVWSWVQNWSAIVGGGATGQVQLSLDATLTFLGLGSCGRAGAAAMAAGGGAGVAVAPVQWGDNQPSPEAFTALREGRGIDPRIAALTPEANAPKGCCE